MGEPLCALAGCGSVKGRSTRLADSCRISPGFLPLFQSRTRRNVNLGQSGRLSVERHRKSHSGHLASLPGSCGKSPAGHGAIWTPSFVVGLLFLVGRGLVPCMLCEHFSVPPRHCFMSAMRQNLLRSALDCVCDPCLSVCFGVFFSQ